MNRLVRTELRKLRTTRTSAAVLAVALAFAGLLGGANAAIAGDEGAPALGSAPWVVDVLGVSTIPAAVALLLGILLAAGEHQHQTITTTFLATPRRARVVAAKALGAALAGPVVAAAMALTAALATVPSLVSDGATVDALHREAAVAVAGVLLSSSLLGALGALLGLLLRSQAATLVLAVAWFTVVEGVVGVLTGGSVQPWLPAHAAADLAASGGRPLWAATLVVAAWAAAVAAVTVTVVGRRDVA